tara:strand:- start:105 stop:233 length:129 start_codon:yes stop_codon:yes gene_type:complete
MFGDVYNRKIVGYELNEAGSGDYAAELLQRCLLLRDASTGLW